MTADIYLDHASATPLRPEAREAYLTALDSFGDPLNIHAPGRAARLLIDDARATVSEAIGAQPDELVFTSGGTESVALAIWGGVRAMRELGTRIVVGAVEHPAVGGVCHVLESDGFEVVLVPVDEHGRIDLDVYAREVRVPGTLLASVQHANHELGTIQQVAEAARAILAIGLEAVRRIVETGVALFLLEPLGVQEIERVDPFSELRRECIVQLETAGQVSCFEQCGLHGDVACRLVHTLVDRAHRMADIETDVP